MSQAAIVARVTLRELWMTFRLLVVFGAFIGISAVVALLPASPAIVLDRVGLGLAVSTVAASVVAALTLSAERASGRAGWLVTRSVARRTYLAGVAAGLVLVVIAGVAASIGLGWSATWGLPGAVGPADLLATLLAVGATAASAVMLGLAAGALLPALPAALLAALLTAGAALVSLLAANGVLLVGTDVAVLPGAAFTMVGDVLDPVSVLPAALRAAGTGLLATAVLLGVATVAIDHAEL